MTAGSFGTCHCFHPSIASGPVGSIFAVAQGTWGHSEIALEHRGEVLGSGKAQIPGSWWQVDLGAVKEITTIRVVPYYGRKDRFYQFVVSTSTDGTRWTTYLDMSRNTKNIGVEGVSYTGQPTPVRYIKIEMLKNSANQWMQLVEVLAK